MLEGAYFEGNYNFNLIGKIPYFFLTKDIYFFIRPSRVIEAYIVLISKYVTLHLFFRVIILWCNVLYLEFMIQIIQDVN